MSKTYIGHFQSLAGVDYTVRIIPEEIDGQEQEIYLAGDNPFTVTYEESENPFSPMRISTASIQVVHNDYLTDVFSPKARGTMVELVSHQQYGDVVEWFGYLKPNLYNQSYSQEFETITLEASDCLASLQYYDYAPIEGGDKKKVATFLDILKHMLVPAGISTLLVQKCHYDTNDTLVLPDRFTITEQNFFSSDTEEPWKQDQVMQEMCKWMGYTAIQLKDKVYLVDFASYNSGADTIEFNRYNFTNDTEDSVVIGVTTNISADSYAGASNDISFDNIYNTISVKESLYICEDFVPGIFNESYLTPRLGDANKCNQVNGNLANYDPRCVGTDGKYFRDNVAKSGSPSGPNTEYYNFNKPYDNKFYESVYRTVSTGDIVPAPLSEDTKKNLANVFGYLGGTVVDEGSAKIPKHQYDVDSKVDFKKYLALSVWDKGYFDVDDNNNFISFLFTYNNKTTTQDLQDAANAVWDIDQPDLHKTVFKLKSGYKLPVVVSEETFVVLSCTAIFEKFPFPFINPDWQKEDGGWYSYAGQMVHMSPAMVFLLSIGDGENKRWWDGTTWKPAQSNGNGYAFRIPLEYEKDDDGKYKGSNWNTSRKNFNNVSWEEWAAVDGFKIPLTYVENGVQKRVDTNGEINFEVKLPSPMEWYKNPVKDGDGATNFRPYRNGACWIEDLSLKFAQKDSVLYEDKDIIYKNVIDEQSINEYDEQDFKVNTYPGFGKLSYSYVGDANTHSFYTRMKVDGMAGRYLSPEQNLLEKLYFQYSTPTTKKNLVLNTEFDQLSSITDGYDNKRYCMLGTEIDYAMDSQTVNLIESKYVDPDSDYRLNVTLVSPKSTTIDCSPEKLTWEVDATLPWEMDAYYQLASKDSSTGGYIPAPGTKEHLIGNVTSGDGSDVKTFEVNSPSNYEDEVTSKSARFLYYKTKDTTGKENKVTLLQEGFTPAYRPWINTGLCLNGEGCSQGCIQALDSFCPVGLTINTNYRNWFVNNPQECIQCGACMLFANNYPGKPYSGGNLSLCDQNENNNNNVFRIKFDREN